MSSSSSDHVAEHAPPLSDYQPSTNEPSQSASFLGLFRADVTDPAGNTSDSYIAVSADLYIEKISDRESLPSAVFDFKGSRTAVRLPLDRLPDTATQEDVDQFISEERHKGLTCLRLQHRREKTKRPRGALAPKRQCQVAYYYIRLHSSDQQKCFFSFLRLALLPLPLLQHAMCKLTEALPSSEVALASEYATWKSVDSHEDQREFADTLIKMAADAGNVITNTTNAGRAAAKFAVGNDMVKDLADVLTGLELIGPIFFTISLIARGIGALMRLKVNRQVLPNLYERLKHCSRECVGILCRAIQVGGVRVNKRLLSDMLLTVTMCWGVSQATERLLFSSTSKLLKKNKDVEKILKDVDKIDNHLRCLHVFDYSQNAVYEQHRRDAEQDQKIEDLSGMVQEIGERSHVEQDKFEVSRASVPGVESAEAIVKEALPKLQELKQAVLGREIVALTGQSKPGHACKAFVEGHGGVGKSTACIAICHDEEVKARFLDGIHYLEFSLEADDEEVVQLLCRAMWHAGMQKMAKEAEERHRNYKGSRDVVHDVVQAVRKCFKDKQVLIVLDNVSFRKRSTGQAKQEWPDLLCSIVEDAPRSQILFSSRYTILARSRFRLVQFGVLQMDNNSELRAAERLIEQYAKDPLNQRPLSRGDVRARDELVRICDGLQLCLCVAGSMVRNNKGRWMNVLETVRKSSLVSDEVDSGRFHPGLRAVMKASLEMLDGRNMDMKRMQGLACAEVKSRTCRSFQSMYASFCILRSARAVPCYLWKSLFGVQTEQEAKAIAQFLEALGLVQIVVKQDGGEVSILHDMQHEFARLLSREKRGVAWQHRQFLKDFARNRFGSSAAVEKVEWSEVCKVTTACEKYMAQNLLRHLVNGAYSNMDSGFFTEDQEEASKFRETILSTLTDFKWIRGRAFSSGRAAILMDYGLALTGGAPENFFLRGEMQNECHVRGLHEDTGSLGRKQKRVLQSGEALALDLVCRALSVVHWDSFYPCAKACSKHKEEGASLGGELLGRLSMIDCKGKHPALVEQAKGVLEGLEKSVKSSVKGPILVPLRGVYTKAIVVSKKNGADIEFNAGSWFDRKTQFAGGGKYFVTTSAVKSSLIFYNANFGYIDVYDPVQCHTTSFRCFSSISCHHSCATVHEHFFLLHESWDGSIRLKCFSDSQEGPTEQGEKELVIGPDEDGKRVHFDHVDASEGANTISAASSNKIWVWRKMDSSICAMEAGCTYGVSSAWESQQIVRFDWVKLTANGTRVLCGKIPFFEQVVCDLVLVLHVTCSADGSLMLFLEHSLVFSALTKYAPVLAKDSHTAYFADWNGVSVVDLEKGQKKNSNIGQRSTNVQDPVEALAMLEDEIVGISPILVVRRKSGGLECWSMRMAAQAELIWEAPPQHITACLSSDLFVRRKPRRAMRQAIELEILLVADRLGRAFSVPVNGLPDVARSNQTVDTTHELEQEAVGEKDLQFSSSRNYNTFWGSFEGMRLICRANGNYALFAGDTRLVLMDLYSGEVVHTRHLDDDFYCQSYDFVSSMDASSDGNWVLLGTLKGTLYQWKLEEDECGLPILTLDHKRSNLARSPIEVLMWCHNGLAFAVAGGNRLIVWDTASHEIIDEKSAEEGCIKSIAVLRSRESDEKYVAYRSRIRCQLYKLCEKNLREEISVIRDSSDTRTLSTVLGQARADLQVVREISHKSLFGSLFGDSFAYPFTSRHPMFATVFTNHDKVVLPRQMTKCGCAPIVAYDVPGGHHRTKCRFRYSVLLVPDPSQLLQIIPGVFQPRKRSRSFSNVSLLHLYENP